MNWHAWHATEVSECSFAHLCGISLAAMMLCGLIILAIV